MSGAADRARAALADRRAWVVGGAVRDALLGRPSADIDVVLAGDIEQAARAAARAAGGAACFALSAQFGAWRVVARDGSWQIDFEPLRGGSIEADLALRDFTVNAVAEPIAGGAPVDPLGGLRDVRERRLRMAGPEAFAADPLRVLRLVRMAVELGFDPDEQTRRSARESAAALQRVSGERVFAELRRILAADRAREGLEMLSALGAGAVVLPELEALRGVEQSRFHHLDVHGHTLAVLDAAVALTSPAAPVPAELAPAVEPYAERLARVLAEPLGDLMTRAQALRWGALLHDAAKPLTHELRGAEGRVTFIGHDVRGAELAREVLARLRASERVRAHVAALVRHHLDLGFLVHEPQPLAAQAVHRYLRRCGPVAVDVTALSLADRLATRGERSREAIAAHVLLARQLLGAALAWHEDGPPAPLLRGDELVRELEIAPGPRIGTLLERLAEEQYAGELRSREQALARARELARAGGAGDVAPGGRVAGS